MTEKSLFGIFAPILGERKDFPVILLDKVVQVDNCNVYRQYGEVWRRKMREPDMLNSGGVKSQTPDANPILHYHTFIKRSTAMQYFLCFTKAHIYMWNTTTKVWDKKFTCQSNCTEWDTITYNDKIIATNNVDMVLVWDTSGYFMPLQNVTGKTITGATQANPCNITAVAHGYSTGNRVFIKNVGGMVELNNLQFVITVTGLDNFTLDGIDSTTYTIYTSGGTSTKFQGIEYSIGLYLTKAKYITTFENYLILGWTTEDGVVYPQRERWNCIANETDWKSAGSGAKETEGHDRIVGFKIYDGVLIIFKEKKRIAQTLVPTTAIWNWSVLPGNIGCMSNHSIVEDADGRVYWLADDLSIREMQAGEISKDIDPIVKKIEPSSAYLTYGIYIEETGEIWWSIPHNNALNNKAITCKGLGNWGELALAVSAFGSYKGA